MLRRLLLLLPALLLAAYAAWPAWSAWELRAAVKARDLAAVERKVDWPALRASLKQTVGGNLDDRSRDPQTGTVTRVLLRSLGATVADAVIDAAVTPGTLAHVLAGRLLLKELGLPERISAPSGSAETAVPDPLAPRQLRWAFFESPTRFRIEMADVKEPHRRIVSVLALQGLAWKLVDVYYRSAS